MLKCAGLAYFESRSSPRCIEIPVSQISDFILQLLPISNSENYVDVRTRVADLSFFRITYRRTLGFCRSRNRIPVILERLGERYNRILPGKTYVQLLF